MQYDKGNPPSGDVPVMHRRSCGGVGGGGRVHWAWGEWASIEVGILTEGGF